MGDSKTVPGSGASRPPMSPTQARQRADELRTEATSLRSGGRERDIVWQRDYEVNKELHSQREAELGEARAEVELMTTRVKQQTEIVSRADEDIRLQTARVAELEQRAQQQGGTTDPVLELELQDARDRLENTKSVQDTDRFDLQQTEVRLDEANRSVEIRKGQVVELMEELLILENSSGTRATEKARKLEAEAKALEDRLPDIEQQWDTWEAGQQAPADATDLGTITFTALPADARTEGLRVGAAKLEEVAAHAEGRSYADQNSAADRRELSARHTARVQEIDAQIASAEARDATLAARSAESTGRADQLRAEVVRQEATLKRLEDAGDADPDAVAQMRSRVEKSREAVQSEEGRARSNDFDRDAIRSDLEGLRTESARITKEAEDLESEATILELRAADQMDTAVKAREVAATQDRIANQIEEAKATGEHVRVKYVDPEDGREVEFEIPGAVTRPDGQPRDVIIDPAAPASSAPDDAASAMPADDGGEAPLTDGTEAWPDAGDPTTDVDAEQSRTGRPTTPAAATVTATAAASTVAPDAADLALTMPTAAAAGAGVADWDFNAPVTTNEGPAATMATGDGEYVADPSLLQAGELVAEGDMSTPWYDEYGTGSSGDTASVAATTSEYETTGSETSEYDTTEYDPTGSETSGYGTSEYDLSGYDPTAPVTEDVDASSGGESTGADTYATETSEDEYSYADDSSSDTFNG